GARGGPGVLVVGLGCSWWAWGARGGPGVLVVGLGCSWWAWGASLTAHPCTRKPSTKFSKNR
ncbi:hypothetical protein ACUY2L_11510, partial [Corynebacterium mastitidis]